jgi:integrase
LQRGRTEARETEPVKPVSDRDFEATLPHLPEVVGDMARVQRLTGCRPGEVCAMRPKDIDRTGNPWQYRPASHKTVHVGRERIIFIGPRAQAILLLYLLREPESYCFSPADSERKRKETNRQKRRTPVQPSQRDRRKRRPKVQPTDRYVKDAYARAIRRACDAADEQAHRDDPTTPITNRIVRRWTPNALRHTAATTIRREFGLEAAQVCLGHSAAVVTQIYAERDWKLAKAVMQQIG